MSGICGIIEPACLPDGIRRIDTMLDAMSHRGRDSRGSAAPTENVFLGCVHQADIDTQPDAKQPLVDPETGNILLFNGEIYNFKELQALLTKRGCAFATGSDAEVLLMAYSVWGTACLNRLRGVFAFALWDAKERRLFAARDAMGVMPFYYFRDGHRFVFASEVRALLASGIPSKELDPSGLESLLAYGSVQEPFTLVQGIRSLPPGCFFEMRSREPFVALPFTHEEHTPYAIPEDDIIELLQRTLTASVKMQSFADVPVCMLFNGSPDTLALASLMRAANVKVRAFAMQLDPHDGEPAESNLAETAASFGLELETIHLEEDRIRADFLQAVDSYDQPAADGIGTWFASKLIAARGPHVAISSIGCNALFTDSADIAAYRRTARRAAFMRRVPRVLLNLAKPLVASDDIRELINLGRSDCQPYLFMRRLIASGLLARILGSRPVPQPRWLNLMTANLKPKAFAADPVNLFSYMELMTRVRSTMLRNADQLGMAHGLEIRMPFMDHVAVNMMLRTPGALKLSGRLLPKVAGLKQEQENKSRPETPFPTAHFMDELCHREIDELFHLPPLGCMKSLPLVQLWNAYKTDRTNWRVIWTLYTALRWIQRNLQG